MFLRNPMRNNNTLSMVIISYFIMGSSFAFGQNPVGMIIERTPEHMSAYEIKRTASVPISSVPGSLLYEGDEISVVGEDAKLTIVLGGTKIVSLTRKDPPRTLNEMNVPTVGENFMKWVNELFQSKEGHPELTTATSNRGDPKNQQILPNQDYLTLPHNLFPSNSSYFMTGRRPLHLAWKGGNPPYAVSVARIGKENCQKINDFWVTQERHLTTEEIEFERGYDYQVVIKDSHRKETRGTWSVVKKVSPSASEGLQQMENKELYQIIQASDLIQQDKRWSFEVYQQISAIAERHNSFAEQLRTRLEQ